VIDLTLAEAKASAQRLGLRTEQILLVELDRAFAELCEAVARGAPLVAELRVVNHVTQLFTVLDHERQELGYALRQETSLQWEDEDD
jgi:hypothetical protein